MEYDVIPKNKYNIIASMKLDNHTTQSILKLKDITMKQGCGN